jgi:hypothetical protein
MSFRRGVLSLLPILLVVSSASSLHGAEGTRYIDAQAHFRLSGGSEETVRLSNFHFVYYARRYILKPTGFGKPGRLEIKDVPHETIALQNEEGDRIKFKKLKSLRLEYQGQAGHRQLVLVATFKKKKKPPKIWPAVQLRNTSVAKPPHFRGRVQNKMMDLTLPDLAEPEKPAEKVLLSLDFVFEGQKPDRDRF